MGYPAQTIIEAKCHYIVNGQECMNVFHYSPFSNGGATDILTLVDDFLDGFTIGAPLSVPVALSKCQAKEATTIYKCTAQMIHPQRYILRTKETDFEGGFVEGCTRQNTGFSITKTGIFGNRANISTTHVGGVPDGAFNAGELTPAYKPVFDTLAEALTEQVTGPNTNVIYDPCILNKEKIPDSDPVKFRIKGYTLITKAFVQTTARTMRRRTVRLGI